MAQSEEAIIAEGAQIIWVLESDRRSAPGTSVSCRDFIDAQGSDAGICVGDGETMPTARAWDQADIAIFRGFDVIVRRADMQVVFTSSHGSPSGNENLTGEELLAEVRRIKNGG